MPFFLWKMAERTMSDRDTTAAASQGTRHATNGKAGRPSVPADLEENAEDRSGTEDGLGLGSSRRSDPWRFCDSFDQ